MNSLHTCFFSFLLMLTICVPAHSAVRLYTGTLDIRVTSGSSCDGVIGKHDISLVVRTDDSGVPQEGYFNGEKISLGRFSGSDLARLEVRYPFVEELRSTGHSMSIERLDEQMTGELRDRHAADDAEDCNFDLARFELVRAPDNNAISMQKQLSTMFDAQLNRSQALALSQKSNYQAALPFFEKALALADAAYPAGSDQLSSYVIGLATCYIWLERFDQFNDLFDKRIEILLDDSVRTVFSGFRIRPLMAEGRTAMKREEYDLALEKFESAHRLQPQNSEAVISVVSVYLKREQYQEAIGFLDRTGSLLKSEADRREVSSATAMILAKKARKDDKAGNGAEAEKALARAMELDPDSVQYLIALARLRHKSGSLSDAETLLDKGEERFKDPFSQSELKNARERIIQTETILRKIRKAGS